MEFNRFGDWPELNCNFQSISACIEGSLTEKTATWQFFFPALSFRPAANPPVAGSLNVDRKGGRVETRNFSSKPLAEKPRPARLLPLMACSG